MPYKQLSYTHTICSPQKIWLKVNLISLMKILPPYRIWPQACCQAAKQPCNKLFSFAAHKTVIIYILTHTCIQIFKGRYTDRSGISIESENCWDLCRHWLFDGCYFWLCGFHIRIFTHNAILQSCQLHWRSQKIVKKLVKYMRAAPLAKPKSMQHVNLSKKKKKQKKKKNTHNNHNFD